VIRMRGIAFKDEVWDLIRQLTLGMELVFRPIVASFGLTMTQTRLLVEIARSDLATVGSLADLVGLSSGNASLMCKKLERAGFIRRIRDSRDERVVKLVLTPRGTATLQKIDQVLQDKYGAFLESKAPQDFETIIAGMKKINELLIEMGKLNKNDCEA
ncbi:MAG TPA: MarR family transcriptional regulator, partial [Bacillota bacterium]